MAHLSGTASAGVTAHIAFALAAPFRALVQALVRMGECAPQMREVNRLNALSDSDLAQRGLTREGEIRRIFADRFYM